MISEAKINIISGERGQRCHAMRGFPKWFFRNETLPNVAGKSFSPQKIVEFIGTALPLALGKGETVWVPHFSEHEV